MVVIDYIEGSELENDPQNVSQGGFKDDHN